MVPLPLPDPPQPQPQPQPSSTRIKIPSANSNAIHNHPLINHHQKRPLPSPNELDLLPNHFQNNNSIHNNPPLAGPSKKITLRLKPPQPPQPPPSASPTPFVHPPPNLAQIRSDGLQLWNKLVNTIDQYGRLRSIDFMDLPSAVDYPDYYTIIPRPVALNLIKAKLESDQDPYPSFDKVLADFRLVFNNAKKYNVEHSTIFDDACALLRVIKRTASQIANKPSRPALNPAPEPAYPPEAGPGEPKQKKLKLKFRASGPTPTPPATLPAAPAPLPNPQPTQPPPPSFSPVLAPRVEPQAAVVHTQAPAQTQPLAPAPRPPQANTQPLTQAQAPPQAQAQQPAPSKPQAPTQAQRLVQSQAQLQAQAQARLQQHLQAEAQAQAALFQAQQQAQALASTKAKAQAELQAHIQSQLQVQAQARARAQTQAAPSQPPAPAQVAPAAPAAQASTPAPPPTSAPAPVAPPSLAPKSVHPSPSAQPSVPLPPPPHVGSKKETPPTIKAWIKSIISALEAVKDKDGRSLIDEFQSLPDKGVWKLYYSVIASPIAFENIRGRNDKRGYKDIESFKEDVLRIFKNAQDFNEDGSAVWNDSKVLQEKFLELIKNPPKEFSEPILRGPYQKKGQDQRTQSPDSSAKKDTKAGESGVPKLVVEADGGAPRAPSTLGSVVAPSGLRRSSRSPSRPTSRAGSPGGLLSRPVSPLPRARAPSPLAQNGGPPRPPSRLAKDIAPQLLGHPERANAVATNHHESKVAPEARRRMQSTIPVRLADGSSGCPPMIKRFKISSRPKTMEALKISNGAVLQHAFKVPKGTERMVVEWKLRRSWPGVRQLRSAGLMKVRVEEAKMRGAKVEITEQGEGSEEGKVEVEVLDGVNVLEISAVGKNEVGGGMGSVVKEIYRMFVYR